MTLKTPTDSYSRPAALGSFGGSAVPMRVAGDGSVCVSVRDGGAKYELVKTLRLDLSEERVLQEYSLRFDAFAVVCADKPFTMYIGSTDEDMRCHIDKCLAAGICADAVYISNAAHNGFAEIWFLKQRREVD